MGLYKGPFDILLMMYEHSVVGGCSFEASFIRWSIGQDTLSGMIGSVRLKGGNSDLHLEPGCWARSGVEDTTADKQGRCALS